MKGGVWLIIKKIKLNNFTVFEDTVFDFNPGINILVGENGTGKTHIMKLLYSACQSANQKITFPQKIVNTMHPDDYKLSRLVTKKNGNHGASVSITAYSSKSDMNRILTIEFSNKTKRFEAVMKGEENWEKDFKDISSIYIPAKEILSNSYNLVAAVDKDNVRFDDTYIDVINSAKVDISMGRDSAERKKRLSKIESIINGKVEYDANRDEFYLKKGNTRQEFTLVAEGIRKMALLWQLVKNGTLEKGSVLFWDEPEANINPKYISVIAELLLELQRNGVQIFVATHDYMLSKYFEVRKNKGDSIMFYSVEKKDTEGVTVSSCEHFGDLNSEITKSFEELLDEIYDKGVD